MTEPAQIQALLFYIVGLFNIQAYTWIPVLHYWNILSVC